LDFLCCDRQEQESLFDAQTLARPGSKHAKRSRNSLEQRYKACEIYCYAKTAELLWRKYQAKNRIVFTCWEAKV